MDAFEGKAKEMFQVLRLVCDGKGNLEWVQDLGSELEKLGFQADMGILWEALC